jgi:hypothetical protein
VVGLWCGYLIDTDGAGRPCQPASHALVKKPAWPGHEPPNETLSIATNNFTSFLVPVAYYEYGHDDYGTFRPYSQSSASSSKQKRNEDCMYCSSKSGSR